MIKRDLEPMLKLAAQQLPVVAILGPRQSGKTTLARSAFANHVYISLEDLDLRESAVNDPHRFFKAHRNSYGIILDEIQHAPDLLSYIQTIVDEEDKVGSFIITCSQNFLVNQAVSQTLTGRIAIFTLLPLSIAELRQAQLLPEAIETTIFRGSFPRLYAKDVLPTIWYPSYILTYLERDVRDITQVTDLTVFKRFIQLCAGRIGQLLNIASLANDCGIPMKTAKAWLALLEATYVVFLLQPHYKNFSKRLVKTPKIYFYDTGLACSLLGIESEAQLSTHYLRGGLVESLIIAEFFKQFYHNGRIPRIYFWRDNHGHEIDCLIEQGAQLTPIEIKAGQTVTSDYFTGIKFWSELAEIDPSNGFVIYAGDRKQERSTGMVLGWKDADLAIKKP